MGECLGVLLKQNTLGLQIPNEDSGTEPGPLRVVQQGRLCVALKGVVKSRWNGKVSEPELTVEMMRNKKGVFPKHEP
jgi:hypothetical protein